MSGAVVKALEWRVFCARSGNYCEAKAPYGEYVIQSETDGWCLYLPWQQSDVDSVHSTLDYAKAAAQSDYDARIRSALVERKAEPHHGDEWKLVPVKPTLEMAEKGAEAFSLPHPQSVGAENERAALIYRLMLGTAPSQVDSRDALIERLREENADLRSELYRRGQEADDTWLTERERAW